MKNNKNRLFSLAKHFSPRSGPQRRLKYQRSWRFTFLFVHFRLLGYLLAQFHRKRFRVLLMISQELLRLFFLVTVGTRLLIMFCIICACRKKYRQCRHYRRNELILQNDTETLFETAPRARHSCSSFYSFFFSIQNR